MSASLILILWDTLNLLSFKYAPSPFDAVYNSLRLGSKITDWIIFPLCSKAIEIAYWGNPCIKFVVPSRGSIIQR